MRLIDCRTLELKEFNENETPRYIILSHTWGKDEVTLQELSGQDHSELAMRKPGGFLKIKYFCKKVLEMDQEISYGWVDTVCINKTSSAELSEAINSMYRWYGDASECFAYLSDVTKSEISSDSEKDEFRNSKWWTRGWTLQELLAPKHVLFLNANWDILGSKIEFRYLIGEISRIPTEVLRDPSVISRQTIARRMSWAARRNTTRIEDLAYSLMGVFNVNMPLLYGEGEKSFIRLQEEILKGSNDQTILAWKSDGEDHLPQEQKTRELEGFTTSVGRSDDALHNLHQVSKSLKTPTVLGWQEETQTQDEPFQIIERRLGILATHPKYFAECAEFVAAEPGFVSELSETAVTNLGLRICLRIIETRRMLLAVLNVQPSIHMTSPAQISIQLTAVPGGNGILARERAANLILQGMAGISRNDFRTVYLQKLGSDIPAREFTFRPQLFCDSCHTRFRLRDCSWSSLPCKEFTFATVALEKDSYHFLVPLGIGLVVILEISSVDDDRAGNFSIILLRYRGAAEWMSGISNQYFNHSTRAEDLAGYSSSVKELGSTPSFMGMGAYDVSVSTDGPTIEAKQYLSLLIRVRSRSSLIGEKPVYVLPIG